MSDIKNHREIQQELDRMARNIARFSFPEAVTTHHAMLRATWDETNTQFMINTIGQRKEASA